MVSRGGGHSRSMPQAVDRFAADADGADIFGIGAWPIAGASQAHRAAAASPLREAADAPRSSPHACMTIWQPPDMPRPASTRATMRSGQAVPVPNTPAAAATPAVLPNEIGRAAWRVRMYQ